MNVLAGDIGGTHARLALVDAAAGRVVRERVFPSHDAPGLGSLVDQFLAEVPERPERACFAVAGPIINGVLHATNLSWIINAADLSRTLRIPHLALINDFEAVGHALAMLGPLDVAPLQEGVADPDGPLALIGPGTGLGVGFVTRDGGVTRVHSSEGGHATFAPETARERKLAAHLAKRLKRVSTERVVSGPGLAAAYESLSGKAIEPAAVSKLALARKDPDAVEALDIFVAAFGAAAGNLALTVLSTGGVYLAGGIAPAILEKLRDGTFMDAFRQKGRLSPLLGRMPVHVILSPVAGLLGAAVVAAGL